MYDQQEGELDRMHAALREGVPEGTIIRRDPHSLHLTGPTGRRCVTWPWLIRGQWLWTVSAPQLHVEGHPIPGDLAYTLLISLVKGVATDEADHTD